MLEYNCFFCKRNRIALIILMIIVVLLIGESKRNKAVKVDYCAEFDYMNNQLDKRYLFWDYLKAQGYNVEKIRKDTRCQIKNDVNDLSSYKRALDSYFRAFENYAHLGVVDADLYEMCKANKMNIPGGEVLDKQKVKRTYSELKKKGLTEERQTSINLSYNSNSGDFYLRIRSFSQNNIEKDKSELERFINEKIDGNLKRIVIDITDNSGGSDRYWRELLLPLKGLTAEINYKFYYKSGAVCEKRIKKNYSIEKTKIKYKNVLVNRIFESTEKYVVKSEYGDKLKEAAVWLIVNKGVYSSADTFTDLCIRTGWAKVVGNKTSGDGIGYTPSLIQLPQTGLLIRFSEVIAENTSGGINVIDGTTPEYISPKKEQPLETYYRLIKEGKK